MDTGPEVERLVAALRALGDVPVDPSPVIVTARPFHGVPVGRLRALARDWHRAHPGAEPVAVARLADALWNRAVREEMVLAVLILGRDRRSRERFGLRTVDRWLPLIDNWETADALGMWVLAPWVADDPERRYGTLDVLSRRRNPWAGRLALVGCIGTARGAQGSRWWPRVESLVLRLAGEHRAGIPKAVSWVLREHTRCCPDRVRGFLELHAPALPSVVVRETRNKLDTGTKRGRTSG